MLAPVRRQSVVEAIAEQIQEHIRRAGLQPGALLPPERELAETLQVGRSSVREALRLLQAWGWVEVRPQAGVVIAEPSLKPLQEVVWERVRRQESSLREIWEMRRLLEVGMLRWVAERATEEDYEQLEAAVAAFEVMIAKNDAGVEEDLTFHARLADATHNRLFIGLRDMAAYFFVEAHRTAATEDMDIRREAARDHRLLLEALREGQVAEAEAIMVEHLERAVRRGAIPSDLSPAEGTA